MILSNDVLQKIRHEAKYSQELMADLMKMDQGTYNRLENGKIRLRFEHIPKIAEAINKSVDEIFSRFKGMLQINFKNDTAQSNQNFVVNLEEKDFLKQLVEEKERIITSKDELIKTQASTIHLLEYEIRILKGQF